MLEPAETHEDSTREEAFAPDESTFEDDFDSEEDDDDIGMIEVASIVEQLFTKAESKTSLGTNDAQQRNVDSWVWKSHVFVAFMMGYTSLSSDVASLLLTFFTSVILRSRKGRSPQHDHPEPAVL